MKLEDQVCNLELAKKLKELGVKQESYFYWAHLDGTTLGPLDLADKCSLKEHLPRAYEKSEICSAFTVAELGELLPINALWESYPYECNKEKRWVCEESRTIENRGCHAETEADSRAKMLCHLIEQEIVKP